MVAVVFIAQRLREVLKFEKVNMRHFVVFLKFEFNPQENDSG